MAFIFKEQDIKQYHYIILYRRAMVELQALTLSNLPSPEKIKLSIP